MNIQYKNDIPESEAYFALFEQPGWNEEYQMSKEELHCIVAESYYCVSAYDSERLVGFGRVMSDGILHAMIYEMIICPEYQKRGIGMT